MMYIIIMIFCIIFDKSGNFENFRARSISIACGHFERVSMIAPETLGPGGSLLTSWDALRDFRSCPPSSGARRRLRADPTESMPSWQPEIFRFRCNMGTDSRSPTRAIGSRSTRPPAGAGRAASNSRGPGEWPGTSPEPPRAPGSRIDHRHPLKVPVADAGSKFIKFS